VPAVEEQESTVAILDAPDRRERIGLGGVLLPQEAGEFVNARAVDLVSRECPRVQDDPIERHDASAGRVLG
jgi:hypothetical protein